MNFSKFFSWRFILALAFAAVLLIIGGIGEIMDEANGSHRDIADMRISDFSQGDIVKGVIKETLGCALTEETTTNVLGFIPTSKRTSAYYYVIPFYKTLDDIYPEKIVLYRTGNTNQVQQLDKLTDETWDWYAGDADDTYTHVVIDRAKVTKMEKEDRQYLSEYLREYIDIVYEGMDPDSIYDQYMNSVVPFVVTYNIGGDSTMLVIGIILLTVVVIIIVITIARSRSTVKLNNYQGFGQGNSYQPAQPNQNPYAQPEQNPYAQPNRNPYAQGNGTQNPYAQPNQNPYAQGNGTQNPYAQPNRNPYAQQNDDRFSLGDDAYGKDLGDSMPSVGEPNNNDQNRQ